ncbi:MAG TPA: hypothetical protein VK141_09505 [Nitrosomonas sp.]|nr:hypothetical protein [Nitrosomonas sp.]
MSFECVSTGGIADIIACRPDEVVHFHRRDAYDLLRHLRDSGVLG